MMDDKLFIILLLQFVRRGLLDVICRNTGIHGDALRNIIVIVIDLLLAIGLPVVFCVELSSCVFLMATKAKPLLLLAQTMMNGMDHFAYLAITLFILAGYVMEEANLSKRLVDFVNAWLGHIRGSVGVVTVVACAIFAALTGSGPATVAAIGSIMMPALLDAGYSGEDSSGLLAASGALGPIIPPSVPMIVYGAALGVSIPKMFMGSVIPGILLAAAFIVVNQRISKKMVLKETKAKSPIKERLIITVKALPVLFLPFIVLGGIYGGIFTPTEAATIAVVYSLILAFAYREFSLQKFIDCFRRALITSGGIIALLGIATLFSWVLTYTQVPAKLSLAIMSVVHSKWVYMAILCMILFVMGTLMETIATIVLLAPILVPIGVQMGINELHLACAFCIALIVGFITPPFGINLFAAVSTCNQPYTKVVKGVVPYMIAALIIAILVMFVPQLTTWLPGLIYGA